MGYQLHCSNDKSFKKMSYQLMSYTSEPFFDQVITVFMTDSRSSSVKRDSEKRVGSNAPL